MAQLATTAYANTFLCLFEGNIAISVPTFAYQVNQEPTHHQSVVRLAILLYGRIKVISAINILAKFLLLLLCGVFKLLLDQILDLALMLFRRLSCPAGRISVSLLRCAEVAPECSCFMPDNFLSPMDSFPELQCLVDKGVRVLPLRLGPTRRGIPRLHTSWFCFKLVVGLGHNSMALYLKEVKSRIASIVLGDREVRLHTMRP